ncbi:saccharopine dehydrogenase family protein [Mycobacterium asiaticum]|uniref:saccharopine dehydrogenase family protein n=1 Tax=Mycobacterium asiaticum TaxID=1790 RepID=UPI000B32B088|nr:saccharopine dehydrogenase NADP-binding domain-containing protein [Mycobacterium asiaticum]
MLATRKVVFIGAAGEMCRVAVEALAKAPTDLNFVLSDIRPEQVEPLARKLDGRATAQQLDLYDADALRATIAGASLVILGAGPYVRTSAPVIEACLELKIPYLDYDDDVESTEHALSLAGRAKEAGIPIYVGCGASPGMSNVMAVDAADDLDTVERIDLCWLVGEERPNVGRAVLEHMLSISAGDCETWDHGARTVHESFLPAGTFPILADQEEVLLYETAHPEPVTLPRKYFQASRIRCVGGLDPAPMNGLFRGVALAIQNGEISMQDGVDFVFSVATGGLGSVAGWKHALNGMRAQIRRSEISRGEMLKFFVLSAARRRYPYRGGLLVQVHGLRDGKPAVSSRRTRMADGNVMNNMGGMTGTPCAAFALLALDDAEQRSGAFAPEDWADPKKFYDALEAVGVPRDQIVEAL